MAYNFVEGDLGRLKLYYDLEGQLGEFKRQLRQKGGYPHDPHQLRSFLQRGIDGKFFIGPNMISIDRSAPFDPVSFLDHSWKIDEPEDERSLLLAEIDISEIELVTTLKKKRNLHQRRRKTASP